MSSLANQGLVNINGALVRTDLTGMFDIFGDQSSRELVEFIAPQIEANSRYNRGIVPATNHIVQAFGPHDPTDAVGYSAPARLGSVDFATFEWTTRRYAFAGVVISDNDSTELQTMQISAENTWMDTYMPQAYDIALNALGVELAASGNYDASLVSTSLVISPTVDLVGFIEAAKIAMQQQGIRWQEGELRAVVNRTVANALLAVLQVSASRSIAGVPSGGTIASLGANTNEDVQNFFLRYGVQLRISDAVIARTSSSVSQILSDDLVFFIAREGRQASFLNLGVAAQNLGGVGAVVSYPEYNPRGIGYYIDAQWGIARRSNKLAFLYSGVLS
jgi:hypothetical protein